MPDYDALVIGMGPGGEVVATRLLAAGRRVAVVERELIGGECGYWACIPSKTLLQPIGVELDRRRTPGLVEGDLDWPAAREWRDEMVRHLDDSRQVSDYERQGATVLRGAARLTGPGRVEVDGRELTAEHVVVATGSSPVTPRLEGLETVTTWTNREVTGLREIPARVVVLGSSAVAVEVSQYLHGFGAHVTVVGRSSRVLSREEPRVGELVGDQLAARGIEVLTDASPVRAHRDGEDSVLVLEDGREVRGDVVVLATGRRPRADDLAVAAAGGVLADSGALVVDDQCRAVGDQGQAVEGLWAVGDVTGVAQFTHVAKYQARIVSSCILGHPRRARYDAVPRVVFGRPEVAAVGLTQAQARERGHDVVTSEIDLAAALARPWTQQREPAGHLGLVADRTTGLLLGAWAVAPEAGEWIHAPALAIGAKIPLEELEHHVAQFPTWSEGFLLAVEAIHA